MSIQVALLASLASATAFLIHEPSARHRAALSAFACGRRPVLIDFHSERVPNYRISANRRRPRIDAALK